MHLQYTRCMLGIQNYDILQESRKPNKLELNVFKNLMFQIWRIKILGLTYRQYQLLPLINQLHLEVINVQHFLTQPI